MTTVRRSAAVVAAAIAVALAIWTLARLLDVELTVGNGADDALRRRHVAHDGSPRQARSPEAVEGRLAGQGDAAIRATCRAASFPHPNGRGKGPAIAAGRPPRKY